MSDIVLEHGQRILSLDPIGGEKGILYGKN